MSEVESLKEAVTREIDLVEGIEAQAANISQIYDQLEQLHLLVFAASSAPEKDEMVQAMGIIKKGLEEIYQGVNLFRDQGNQYVRRT